MLASVLNPPTNQSLAKSHSSILPLLARGYGEGVEVEGLCRPRMPVLGVGYDGLEGEEGEEDEDEDVVDGGRDEGQDEREFDNGDGVGVGAEDDAELVLAEKEAQSVAFPRQPDPPAAPIAETPTASLSLKRPLPPTIPPLSSPEAKKPRHTPKQPKQPTAISFINSSLDTMMGDDDEQTSADHEAAMVNVPVTATMPEGHVMTNVVAPVVAIDDDDDDDAFVIPELNMEPDTDDDDEEVEGGEGDV